MRIRTSPTYRSPFLKGYGETNPNSTGSSYSYDLAGRLQTITHTGPSGTLASFTYSPDSAGNPLSVQEQMSLVPGAAVGYAYDRLGRLTTVTYPDGQDTAYQYDPMGNRTRLSETTPSSMVEAWGFDEYGQVGDGYLAAHTSPA